MIVATIGKEHYRTEIVATGHHLVADEPVDVGGQNQGPAPGQFLQMSLAACTAITLRMYADRKQWPLEHVRVEVDTEKTEGKTLFKRQLIFAGDLTDEQRQRLLQIANACPVHKALTGPIEIETFLT
ncbi:MAG: OsmC family protein [Bacteroidota bacterium]